MSPEKPGVIKSGDTVEQTGRALHSDTSSFRGFPTLRLIFRECPARHLRSLVFILVAAFLSNIMMLLQPIFVMIVYDRVIPHGAFETLWAMATGVLLGFALDLCVRNIRIRMESAVAIKTSIDLQERLYRRLIRARVQNSPAATAEWTDTFREIDTASAIAPALWASVFVDLPFIIAVLALVYTIAGDVVVAPMAGITLLAIWSIIGSILIRRAGARVAGSQAQRTELLTESASLARTVKYAGAEAAIHGRFHGLLADALQPLHGLRRHSAMQMQLTNFAVQGVIVAAVVIGVYKIASGEMTTGALVATMLLVSRVLMPAGQLVLLITRANEMAAPLRRIFTLLELPQEEAAQSTNSRKVERGKLALSNVTFWHPDAGRPALKSIGLEIEPGEKVALIGRSGSGKSTLLQMLIRVHDPDDGTYLVDGHNALQYAPQALRQDFAYMGQENELFDGSIFENLTLGRTGVEEEHIKSALIASGAFDFVRHNPAGLSQKVGKRGAALSGGERQALCLARTLLQPSKMLLLDEPTSSMDQTMEAQVLDGLKSLGADKTLIIATHRSNILAAVDRIILMNDGQIVTDGPAKQVLSRLAKPPAPTAA